MVHNPGQSSFVVTVQITTKVEVVAEELKSSQEKHNVKGEVPVPPVVPLT